MSSQAATPSSARHRLIIVDPGHFHATLLQKEMYACLSNRVSVYARLGPELIDYLNRIALFNSRRESPTRWDLNVHTSEDPMGEMLRDRPGNVVVFTGRNRGKIDRILAALDAGLNVLADKPWIIRSTDLDKLNRALSLAEQRGLVVDDIMTERYEITSLLQREFVNSPDVFGSLEKGSAANPAIRARSVHHVMKIVAGVPLRRPAWFFDIGEYGEGLADVGTHVVDLVQWTAFPGQPIDYLQDIRLLSGRRWPLEIDLRQFQQVTGEDHFPAALAPCVTGGTFLYFCNNSVAYTLREVNVQLDISWKWQAEEGGDIYEAAFQGSRSRIEIRQGKAENHLPELYIVPSGTIPAADVFAAVTDRVDALQSRWPGLSISHNGVEARIGIPQEYRVGHEAHFGQVSGHFLAYLDRPAAVPSWERPAMLAKYFVSTRGVELG